MADVVTCDHGSRVVESWADFPESSGGRTSWARGRQFYHQVGYQPEGDHMRSSVLVVPFKTALETKGYKL